MEATRTPKRRMLAGTLICRVHSTLTLSATSGVSGDWSPPSPLRATAPSYCSINPRQVRGVV
jgi:hypothetical protein